MENSLPCSASDLQVDMAYRSGFSDHSDPFHAQNCQYIYSSKSFKDAP